MIQGPFTTRDYLEAVGPSFQLDMNKLMLRRKPRASALGSDAREIAYMMSATPYDDPPHEDARNEADSVLTAEQGRMFEDLSVHVIEQMGFGVVDRQIELPDDYFVTGHPDGRLVGPWMDDYNLVCGFEHKHLGRWKYIGIIKHGFMAECPEYVLQAVLYGYALGWDICQFVITAQDASGIRTEALRSTKTKDESKRWGLKDFNPKVHAFAIDLRPLYETLLPAARQRAEWFTRWFDESCDPREVRLEHDPYEVDGLGRATFPWGYSEWLGRARADGQSGQSAPPLFFTGRWGNG